MSKYYGGDVGVIDEGVNEVDVGVVKNDNGFVVLICDWGNEVVGVVIV